MSSQLDFEGQARWTNIDNLQPLITLSFGSMIITTLIIFGNGMVGQSWTKSRRLAKIKSWHIDRGFGFYLLAFPS